MKILSKLRGGQAALEQQGPVNIVFFGDSVTHGYFEDGVCDFEAVYHARLARMLNKKYPVTPVNIINAGIGGVTAKGSLERMERDVLCHCPDAVVVCFGLNDVNGTLEDYISSLSVIFSKLRERHIDTIFMTPNMMNTRMDEVFLATSEYRDYAKVTNTMQTSGKMDSFMDAARKCAEDNGVILCDCYAKWKAMADAGEDTTAMLVNRINHPTREMHRLFAEELLKVIENN